MRGGRVEEGLGCEKARPARQLSTATKESHGKPSIFGSTPMTLPVSPQHPQYKPSDTEFCSVATQDQPSPPNTYWRDTQRQRGRLNTSNERIETQFILSDRFVDDINQMLDFINGWPEHQFQDVKYAFETDPDNQGRKVIFVDLGDRSWGLRLLYPSRRDSGTSCQLSYSYTRKDLPDACQTQGCDNGCPREVSIKEKAADLRRFREGQRNAKSQGGLAGKGIWTGLSSAALSNAGEMQPPPIPPRSPNRSTFDKLHTTGSLPFTPTLECPASPRPRNLTLPSAKSIYKNIQNLESQLEHVKQSMSATNHGPPIDPRDAVKEWLQRANRQFSSSKIADHAGKSTNFGPLGCKLIHKEKVPAGATSIRAEAYHLSRMFGPRSAVSEPVIGSGRRKSWKDYFAARPPPTKIAQGKDAVPKANRQHLGCSAQKIKVRPQYEKLSLIHI